MGVCKGNCHKTNLHKNKDFTHFDRYKTNKYLVEDSQYINLLWFEEGVKNRWPFINVVNVDDSSFS